MLEQPLDLGRREVGVEHEPGARAHERLVPGRPQLLAARRRCGGPARRSRGEAARRVEGSQTQTVSRWLVMPTALKLTLAHAGVGERLAGDRLGHLPDLARIVLDPAGLREVLA